MDNFGSNAAQVTEEINRSAEGTEALMGPVLTTGRSWDHYTAYMSDIEWESLPTQITPKPRKGTKLDVDLVREKLRMHKPCRIVVDGPKCVGKTSLL